MGTSKPLIYTETSHAVNLRVAHAVVRLALRKQSDGPLKGAVAVFLAGLAHWLARGGFGGPAMALGAFSAVAQHGGSVQGYFTTALALARRGRALTARRYLYPEYKSGRYTTPRVTNRGGRQHSIWDDPANNATLPDDLGR